MDTLVLDGVTYVKASVAAKNAGYTSDYVGQLCRGKKVDAKLVGRTWYINPDELEVHQIEKRRVARVKAREQVRKSLAEYQQKENSRTKTTSRYESDDSDLIPTVRRVVPEVEYSNREKKLYEPVLERSDDFAIENKGNSVIMSGDLSVVDVDEVEEIDDSIILRPKIILSKKPHVQDRGDIVEVGVSEGGGGTMVGEHTDATFQGLGAEKNFNFLDRLEENGALPSDEEQVDTSSEGLLMHQRDSGDSAHFIEVEQHRSWHWQLIILAFGILVSFAQIVVSGVYSLTRDGDTFSTEYHHRIDLDTLKNLLK